MHSELLVNLALAGIDDSTRQILREIWPVVQVRVPQVLDALYGQGSFRPNHTAQFSDNTRAAEARAAQEKHWEALFRADFDEEYAASVRRIALTHVRVGLRPAWFISGYQVALTELHSLIVNAHAESIMSWRSRTRMEQAIRAVDKAVMFDLQLGASAYCEELDARHRRRIEDMAERSQAATAATNERMLGAAAELDRTLDSLNATAERARADANAAQDGVVGVAGQAAAIAERLDHVTRLLAAASQIPGASALLGEATAELHRMSADIDSTVQAVAELSRGVGNAARNGARITAGTARFIELASQLRTLADEQSDAALGFVQEARAAERRVEPREPASASVILTFGDREVRGVLKDVSAGGASVLMDTSKLPEEPGAMTIRLPHAACATGVAVAARTPNRLHLRFTDRAAAQPFMTNALDRSASLAASYEVRSEPQRVAVAGCA